MSWTSRVSRYFSRRSFDEGSRYFRFGRVHIYDGDDWAVEARVDGTYAYTVHLKVTKTGLTVSCTCPWFADSGVACKHIWAAMLAAESQSCLGAIENIGNPALGHSRSEDFGQKGLHDTTPEWRTKLAFVRKAAIDAEARGPRIQNSPERRLV